MDFTGFRQRSLTLDSLELLTIDLPQRERFRSAVGWRHSREALFVRWIDRDGHWGIGECSCRPDPYFSHEFLAGATAVIEQILFPNLAQEATYGDLMTELGRIRGWGFAKAAVLEAVHDLWRRKGLQDPVDSWDVSRIERVPVGISLGLYDTSSALLAKIESSLQEGYRRIKLKIKPGLDANYLKDVRKTFPDAYLGCDANGSFTRETMPELERLADYGLAMLEQPFAPDRLDLCAELKQRAPALKICLDEGVAAMGHLIAAHQLGAIDELNIKPGRVGGIPNSIEMAEYAVKHGIPVWIGGMFETGIGRAANLRFAACFPNAKGHDLSPSKRYFIDDLVAQPIDMDEEGYIQMPTEPVQLSDEHINKYTKEKLVKRKEHA